MGDPELACYIRGDLKESYIPSVERVDSDVRVSKNSIARSSCKHDVSNEIARD